MKLGVVLNGISLAKEKFYTHYLKKLKEHHSVEVLETLTRHDAVSLAQKLVARKVDVIIAAGGDGTIHQVVNGMLRDYQPPTVLPVLAVLPLGSGNDFARALGADSSPAGLVKRIMAMKTRFIDVGDVHYSVSPPSSGVTSIQDSRFFVNVVDVGMGPTVVKGVTDSGRAFGSGIAYYQSILKTFLTFKAKTFHAVGTDWKWTSKMKCFAIANAKYFGNGLCVAPDADLEDRVLDVFACGGVSAVDFILQTIPLKKGKKINHPKVFYFKTQSVEMTAEEPTELEADGEIIGWLPAKATLSAHKLQILA